MLIEADADVVTPSSNTSSVMYPSLMVFLTQDLVVINIMLSANPHVTVKFVILKQTK